MASETKAASAIILAAIIAIAAYLAYSGHQARKTCELTYTTDTCIQMGV